MPRGFWPVDWMILGYLAAVGVVLAVFFARIPGAGTLLLLHAAGMLVIAAFALRPDLPGGLVFRHWYPLPYVAACYREMSILISGLRTTTYDAQLAAWDRSLWGVEPTVWMEHIQSPPLTEFLQLAYSLFVPCVLAVAVIFWVRSDLARFRSYAFLIAMGFLVSYVGYFIVPARGPRFLLAAEYSRPLTGLWLTAPLRKLLDILESAHYDCFPSGHIEMTVLAWWASRRISRRLGWVYALYTMSVIIATIYLHYHYTIDLMAGIIFAGSVIVAAPYLERWGHRGNSSSRTR